jgi:NAD(P)-dependent dehydrogenase (short-subunit alcohol dehydrogenase family)
MKKSVLITGATSGIGRALAVQLAARKWRVLASGRDTERLAALQAETGCLVAAADVTNEAEAVALFDRAWNELNGVDALVNSAGINHIKAPVAEIEVADWEQQMAINLRAPMVMCREAMRRMEAGGHILNVVSTIALTSQPNYSIYTASKYGLLGFTNSLRKEAQAQGIKVTAAFPGGTDTDFRPEERPEYMRAESAAVLLVQALEAPADVAVHEVVYRPMVETNF